MGYGVLSSILQMHYVEWVGFNKTALAPDFAQSFAVELYDTRRDPAENSNVAGDLMHASAQAQLRKVLVAQFEMSMERAEERLLYAARANEPYQPAAC